MYLFTQSFFLFYYLFIYLLGCSETDSAITETTHWPSLPAPDDDDDDDDDDDEFEADGGINDWHRKLNTRRKPATVPLCSPQISYD
jgi:hypothetical protein